MKHEYFFEVRGNELDSFNHVNNAVYVNYLEAARWKFFQDTTWLDYMKSNNLFPVVIETNIRYVNELRVFDKAVVKSNYKCDGDYIVVSQNIYLEESNKKAAKATVKMIIVSKERMVQEIPEFIKSKLEKVR